MRSLRNADDGMLGVMLCSAQKSEQRRRIGYIVEKEASNENPPSSINRSDGGFRLDGRELAASYRSRP